MRLIVPCVVLVVPVLCGCATGTKELRSELADLRKRIDAHAEREADQARKLDDLANQIAILQDRVESQRVAAMRQGPPPRLPRVAIKTTAEGAKTEILSDLPPSDEDVEYAGEAARGASGPRPVLRIEGEPPPRGARGRAAAEEPVDEPAAPPATARAEPAAPAVRAARRASHAPAVAAAPAAAPGAAGERLPVPRAPAPPVPGGLPDKEKAARPAPPRAIAEEDGASRLYQDAMAALRRGEHDVAITGFRRFVATYPQHDFADNAQYWLGEAFYDRKEYALALGEFRQVIERYPSGNKAPDALLKVGYCYGKVGQARAARDVLEQVVRSYPNTSVAQKAQEKLAEAQ
jgi:tol-pal system protein YbgF